MQFYIGQPVEMTEELARQLSGRTKQRRLVGTIVGFPNTKDCCRVKWDGMTHPESIWAGYLRPIAQTVG